MVKYLEKSDDLRLVTFGERVEENMDNIIDAVSALKEVILGDISDSGALTRSQLASIFRTINENSDKMSFDREAFMRTSLYIAVSSINGYSFSICEVVKKIFHHYEAKFPSFCIAFLLLLPENLFKINHEICNFFSKIFSLEELDGKFTQKSFRELSACLADLCTDQEKIDLINKINSAAIDMSIVKIAESYFISGNSNFEGDMEYSESSDEEIDVEASQEVSEEFSDLISKRMMLILEQRNNK